MHCPVNCPGRSYPSSSQVVRHVEGRTARLARLSTSLSCVFHSVLRRASAFVGVREISRAAEFDLDVWPWPRSRSYIKRSNGSPELLWNGRCTAPRCFRPIRRSGSFGGRAETGNPSSSDDDVLIVLIGCSRVKFYFSSRWLIVRLRIRFACSLPAEQVRLRTKFIYIY